MDKIVHYIFLLLTWTVFKWVYSNCIISILVLLTHIHICYVGGWAITLKPVLLGWLVVLARLLGATADGNNQGWDGLITNHGN